MSDSNSNSYIDKQKDSSIKKISKAFNKLKLSLSPDTSISNDPLNFKLDQRITKALNKLSINNNISASSLNWAENMKSILTKSIDSSSFDQSIFMNVMQSPEIVARFSRYNNADSILENIPYCARALKVLTDGIISPDNITKEALKIISNSKNEEIENQLADVKNINKVLKFEKNLFNIIYTTLKYGDIFIEICDTENKDIPLSQSIFLTENKKHYNYKLTKKDKENFVRESTFNVVFSKKQILTDVDDNSLYTDTTSKNKNIYLNLYEESKPIEKLSLLSEKNNKDEGDTLDSKLDNVKLLFHNPREIVKIQSVKHKICLGYLVLPDIPLDTNMVSTSSSGVMGSSVSHATPSVGMLASLNGYEAQLGIDSIYTGLVTLIAKHIHSDIKVDKKEMLPMLKRIVDELSDKDEYKINIRYVQNENMEHFYINNNNYFPYGEGIFQKSLYSAKLLMALETSVTIRRMTDSSEKRIIYVESGIDRKFKNTLETFKDAMKKRKYSMSNMTDINSIPTMITTHEDYYLPQNKGKRYVDFETLPPKGNIADAVEELKYFRDKIVASLEIPPAFLSLEESLSNKSVLAHESSIFAETILSYQKQFTEHLNSLFSKIYKLCYNKPLSEDVIVTLPSPKMLYVERQAEHIEVITRLVDGLTSLGIPRDYAIKKYLDMDWDEVEDAKREEDLENQIKPPEDSEVYGGGADMGMGVAPGFGGYGSDFGGMEPTTGVQPGQQY